MVKYSNLVKINVKIDELLLTNGSKFPVKQAQSFRFERWSYIISSALEVIHQVAASKKVGKDTIRRAFSPIHSMYRIQQIMKSLEPGMGGVPLVHIRKDTESDKYVLVDGRHRVWAYILMGMKEIPAILFPPGRHVLFDTEWCYNENTRKT